MLKKLQEMKHSKKWFTLAELLIVVAIIAVLVAISIPVFTTQLEKSKEATDLANIRAAYAQASVNALDADNNQNGIAYSVAMTQNDDNKGWQYIDAHVAGSTATIPNVHKGQYVKVTVNGNTGVATFEAVATPGTTTTE